MREIKFSLMWTNGESWMDLRYTLDELIANKHLSDVNGQESLKRFYLKFSRQFTGLFDKNGVEIYEKDCVYLAGYGEYICEFPFIELYEAHPEGDIGAILGNIHESPELLNT